MSKIVSELDRVLSEFNLSKRSFHPKVGSGFGGAYTGTDKAHCIIGHMLTNVALRKWAKEERSSSGDFNVLQAYHRFNPTGDFKSRDCKMWYRQQLRSPFKTLTVDVLDELQTLHDNSCYWDKDGLSKRGEEQYDLVKSLIQG